MRRVVWLSLLVLWAACGRPSAEKPPVIRYGEDACEECKMLISESRFAAAYTTKEGTWRFDDIGCMVLHYRKHDGESPVFWVHDYETGEWVRGDQAFFVVGAGVYTPMAYGIVAFADSLKARDLSAQKGGKVLRLQALLRGWKPMRGGHHYE